MKRFGEVCWRPLLAAFFLSTFSIHARLVELTVLHTTDLHGHVLPSYTYGGDENVGGFLRCATYIQQVRSEVPNTLYLDCGDLTQGSIESDLSQGRIITKALEWANCDGWAIGNHEFDQGLASIQKILAATDIPKLGANFYFPDSSDETLPGLLPFRMMDIDGIRVAILGLTTPGIPYWSRPFLIEPLRVKSSVEALQEIFPAVRAEEPDVIILATHQGLKPRGDDFANEIGQIARNFPDIDLILGGHSHRVIELEYIHDIPYSQAGYHANWVGRIDLSYDTVKKKVTELRATVKEMGTEVEPSPELEAHLQAEVDAGREFMNRKVGELRTVLPGRSHVPGHSAQQQLICDAIQAEVNCDFIIHGAFSDQIFPIGPVTESMLYRMVPYENWIGVLLVTKEDLKTILEENAAQLRSFYFMGNAGFQYDLYKEEAVGERVANLRLANGKPLHPRKRYRLALNSYVLASGGQRYPETRRIADAPISRLEWHSKGTRDLVRKYFKSRPSVAVTLKPGLTIQRGELVVP